MSEEEREIWEEKAVTLGRLSDLTGRRFGRLVVLGFAGRGKCGIPKWRCKCDCGGESTPFVSGLRSGRATSCGCINRERYSALGKARRTHGMSHSKEESAWRHAIARCTNKKTAQYEDYGGRGITVCARWMASFENFLADMGSAPTKDHSLDRIDTNKGYSPENCRWATWTTQQRNRRNNRRIEINGVSRTLAEWCEIYGVGYKRSWARIVMLGIDPVVALSSGRMKPWRVEKK